MNSMDINLILRSHLRYFVRRVADELIDAFKPNWHVDAIAHQLERVRLGECRNLIITQPPRSVKSICASVAFPAWILGHNPRAKVICVSYGSDLGTPLSRQCQQIMNTPWYRSLFPATVLASETQSELRTNEGGFRLSATIDGALTGRGADFLIVDDPIKAQEVYSETTRKRVNEWFGNTAASRLDDKTKGAFILTMQRLHEDDPVGDLTSKQGANLVASSFDERLDDPPSSGTWTHLNLPAITDIERFVPLPADETYRWAEGEPLQKLREPVEVLDNLKTQMGHHNYSAQYLQAPIPAAGNIIKREWLRYGRRPVDTEISDRFVQSWDIATSEKDSSDFSVCTTWLCVRNKYYLLDVWRGRLEFPALADKAISLWRQHNPGVILIEKTGLGLPFIQNLRSRASAQMVVVGVKAELDKRERLIAASFAFEGEQVILPEEAPWRADYEAELLGFPNTRHDDQVDSTSQFLNWERKRQIDDYYDDVPMTCGAIGIPYRWSPDPSGSGNAIVTYDVNANDKPKYPWD